MQFGQLLHEGTEVVGVKLMLEGLPNGLQGLYTGSTLQVYSQRPRVKPRCNTWAWLAAAAIAAGG